MSRPQQWGAAYSVKAERWHGPFDTLEEAIAKAAELDESGAGGAICECQWPAPCEFVVRTFDMDDLLERMDERAFDDGVYSDDEPVFEAGPGAQEALEAALRAWAGQYVTVTTFTAHNPRPARPAPAGG